MPKRKSGGGASSSSSSSQQQTSRLFSTLASIEQTDKSASKKRKASQFNSLQQSYAASDQSKISGILLELRILTQRCLTESSAAGADDGITTSDDIVDDNDKEKEEVDVLLENLLVARRELMGNQLDKDDGKDNEVEVEEKSDDLDYAKLIQQHASKEVGDDNSDEDGGSSSSNDDSDGESSSNKKKDTNLTAQLQSEYTSLAKDWKRILNKHHSNLVLHSGMSVNNSKFQSKAVDVSFWEQIQGGLEHELFKQRTAASSSKKQKNSQDDDEDDGEGDSDAMDNNVLQQFDDSKLYQQMLKDFISSSSSSSQATSNNKGMVIDPAAEAATRLKRALRKKSGGTTTNNDGDVDLTTLLTAGGNNGDGTALSINGIQKKTTNANIVDRRASKGRKIRYTVNPKLVNFTFPVDRNTPMIKEGTWFKSLFGGAGRM